MLYRAKAIYHKPVCRRWKESFVEFLKDMGPRPSPKHSIDRKENRHGYYPWNCRWVTSKEQCRNKTNNHRVEVSGESLTVVEWSERFGVPARVIYQRLYHGWSPRRAVSTPRRTA